jgi:hypothetical protein
MSRAPDFDSIARQWLADGPVELSDRVLDAAFEEIHITRQRRAGRVPWRPSTMLTTIKFVAAGAAVVITLVLARGLFADRGSTPAVGTSPAPARSPALSLAPSPSAIPAAFLPSSGPVEPGSYATDLIRPGVRFGLECCFEVRTHDSGLLVMSEIGLNRYLVLSNPTQVMDPTGDQPQPLPDDLIGWFVSHPGLDASPAETVTIGGLTGAQTEGLPRPDANFDSSGQLALTDSIAVPPLYIESDQRFRIIVLDGPEGPVVVAVIARTDVFDEFTAKADAIVSSLRFGQ